MKSTLIILITFFYSIAFSQTNPYLQIARIKYNGGGDWYNDPSAEVNLLKFISKNTNIKTNPVYTAVDLETNEIFNYPISFITGHGNILFTNKNISILKKYLENGGFLYVDDDYGLDKSFRREIKKVFPNKNLIELPFNHDIYNIVYKFENGPPKIHEHDNKPPRGYGLFLNERMVIFYTVESNPSDGWANQDVHNDLEEKRLEALKFGTNIISYILSN
ncbi:MAG: hypothetical protein CR986_03560 [Ignavibacteriae bacterium]|nr:MAG: hypothetical protein CR986_03560 [Ignavibacteriota bacterium]